MWSNCNSLFFFFFMVSAYCVYVKTQQFYSWIYVLEKPMQNSPGVEIFIAALFLKEKKPQT